MLKQIDYHPLNWAVTLKDLGERGIKSPPQGFSLWLDFQAGETCHYWTTDLLAAGMFYETYKMGCPKTMERFDEASSQAFDTDASFTEQYKQLCLSDDYALVERFARVFENGWSKEEIKLLRWHLREPGKGIKEDSDSSRLSWLGSSTQYAELKQLQASLTSRKWTFSATQILILVEREKKYQCLTAGQEKILRSDPHDRTETITAFLDVSSSNDEEMLLSLGLALNQLGESFPKPAELKAEVIRREQEREQAVFEKRLFTKGSELDLWNSIDSMDGYAFEEFLNSLFTKMGFEIQQTKRSRDQGADLVATKFGERVVIQVKRFSGRVGNSAIQEAAAAVALYNASRGMVVTNSYFTSAAKELAQANKIELVERETLRAMVEQHW